MEPSEHVEPPAPEPDDDREFDEDTEPEATAEPEPQPEPEPEPMPGSGDFEQLITSMGIDLPEPHVPSVVARDSCDRFSEGQSMAEVSGWLGEFSGFDQNTQGRFLGAAIATYCPENIDTLG